MKNITMISTFFIFLFVVSTNAQTNPREFNFSGQLTDAVGNPNTGTNVSFTIEIKSPTGCTLYKESQTLNLSTSDGYFSIGVGSVVGSSKRVSGDAGNAMQTVFRNSGVISGDSCTYTPSAGDQRQLVVTVDDGATTETLSAQWIKTVPTALQAENAETVGGFTPSQLLRVNTTSAVLSQSNLESIFTNPNYTTLTNLLAGTSTLYSKPAANGTSVLPEIVAPTTPAPGQVWYNAGNIQYFDGTQTQTLSTGASTSVAVNSGSATAPSISFSGNPGSGWFSPGTGQLAASTANLERIRIVNNGNVGIGNSAPTAKLHLAPGTSAVGTAPLKLTAGSNLTTPEAGAIEFDGTSLFYTDNTNTRRTVSTGGGSSVTTLAGDVTSTGTPVASTTITSGAVTTTKLANDAVSFEKLQNISNNRILGRSAAGTGDVEELTIGSGLTLTAGILSAASGVDSFALLPCADGFVPFKSAGAWGCKAADTILANNSLVLRDATGNFEGNQITTNTLRLNNAGSFVNINNPPTANYSLTLPTTTGAANQVLQTNGAGILSWASVGSGDFMASGSLPMTGSLRLTAGTATSPALTFSGDTNTGLYSNTPDSLFFATNGTQKMVLNSAGNLGIGATNPSSRLHVVGFSSPAVATFETTLANSSPQAVDIWNKTNPTSGSGAALTFSVGAPSASQRSKIVSTDENASNSSLQFWNTKSGTLSESMRISGDGNVGINTIAPDQTLHVNGAIRLEPLSAAPVSFSTGDLYVNSGGDLFYNKSGTWMNLTSGAGDFRSDGSVPMTAPIRAASGTIEVGNTLTPGSVGLRVMNSARVEISGTGAPTALSLKNSNGGTTGVSIDLHGHVSGTEYLASSITGQLTGTNSGYLAFKTNNSGSVQEQLRIGSNGNVGIGTTNPAYKLDVVGDLRITGTPFRNGGDVAWTVPSDERLKDITAEYNRGLNELNNLRMIKFRYKEGNPKGIPSDQEYTGVIAQEVQKQIPEAVKEDKDGFLSLNTTPIFWSMINAIKELYARSVQSEAELARELNSLRDENAQLKLRIDAIEKKLNSK